MSCPFFVNCVLSSRHRAPKSLHFRFMGGTSKTAGQWAVLNGRMRFTSVALSERNPSNPDCSVCPQVGLGGKQILTCFQRRSSTKASPLGSFNYGVTLC